jgi:molybdenum cofactor biosynthesis enzyme MoaA
VSHPDGDEYYSCEWIEGGIAFNVRSLHTCLIAHHHTGHPLITDFRGGEFPLEKVLAMRERIREANRNGGYPACQGCAHLKKRAWPRPTHAIHIVGIAHYMHCNIKCTYCFLQTQDPAPFAAGFRPYPLLPVVRGLIDSGRLAPDAIIDWGGGEPTVYKEFDELLELLLAHGTFHYVHTNGTRLPEAVRRTSAPQRVHVICSVDAGRPETYLLIKKRDYLDRVWANLGDYVRLGVKVTLKYIVKAENCADAELEAFLARAVASGAPELIVDIDYDFPDPTAEVVTALARLKHRALRAGLHARYGFTGHNYANEQQVAARVEAAFRVEQLAAIAAFLRGRGYPPAECADLTVEALVRTLEEHCARKDEEILAKHEEVLRRQRQVVGLTHEVTRQRAEIERLTAILRRKFPARLARLVVGLRNRFTLRRVGA